MNINYSTREPLTALSEKIVGSWQPTRISGGSASPTSVICLAKKSNDSGWAAAGDALPLTANPGGRRMGSGDVCLLTEVRGRLGHGEKHPSPIKLTVSIIPLPAEVAR